MAGLPGMAAMLSACAGGEETGAGPSPNTTTSPTIPPSISHQIRHVIIIQENRTPDNLFHGLPRRRHREQRPGFRGPHVVLQPVSSYAIFSGSHSDFHPTRMTLGDERLRYRRRIVPHPPCAYSYVPPSDVGPYFQMAEQYTFADHMFQTNQGPSFPAHQYLIAGTSEPSVGSDLLAAENPDSKKGETFEGCNSSPNVTVNMIDPAGDESTKMFPCFEHPTLTDLLDAKNATWKYYTPSAGSLFTAPAAINHIRFDGLEQRSFHKQECSRTFSIGYRRSRNAGCSDVRSSTFKRWKRPVGSRRS